MYDTINIQYKCLNSHTTDYVDSLLLI